MPPRNAIGHVPQVRAVALTDYVPLAQSLGLDGLALLREFGIGPHLLSDPESRLPADAASALLAESALRSGCETFGLLLAERRSFASLGPLSLLLRHEANLRAVVQRIIAYRRLLTDILEFDLEERGGEARLVIAVAPETANRQTVELVMALCLSFLGGALFGGWTPSEAHFRHAAPSDDQVHRRAFRAKLCFDSTFNGFAFPAEMLDRENVHGDRGFVEHAQNYVDLLAQELPEPALAEQVRATILQLLPAGDVSLGRVAGRLNLHPRTLQRRLAVSGLVFSQLVETVREGLARDLLANTDLPLSEIALLIGYASQTSFSRWFSTVAGQPPREWRLRDRSQASASSS